ncbi:MAG: peptidylprolyl isomerase [Actinomycetota bacterium]
MASEKRARQRAQRDAKRAAELQAAKRKSLYRRIGIIVVVAAAIIGSAWLIFKPAAKTPVTTTTTALTTTTLSGTTTTVANARIAALQKAADKMAVAAGCPASTSAKVNNLKWKSEPPMTIDASKSYTATVSTTAGTFTIALDPKLAPHNVNNFVFLAKKGFYHCVIFHRVIPDFVIQGGDPTGTGTGGPGYALGEDEYPAKAANPALQYPIGSVAMANNGSAGTNGSQFFIVTGINGEGLPNTYTLFGHITSGAPTVKIIQDLGTPAGVPPQVTERMLSVTIAEH